MINTDEQIGVPKILVIDDDPITRLMLVKTLTKSGYEVEEADGGITGVEKVSSFLPELILLDVMMPDMDGFETCDEIRKIRSYSETPIIMLTGLNDESSVDRAFDIGANDFVTKPINWSLLVKRVKYLIRDSIINMQLIENEARLRQSQRIAKIFYWELIPSNLMFTMSEAFKEHIGFSVDSQINCDDFMGLIHQDERSQVEKKINKILQDGQSYHIDHHIKSVDGRKYVFKQHAEALKGKNGDISRIIGTLQDITQQRHAESIIEYQRYYDELTALPNKKLFYDKLDESLNEHHAGSLMAVVFIGIDRFKTINESLGYGAGDVILQNIGGRIKKLLSGRGVVARNGSDTFSVILNNQSGLSHIENIVDEIRISLSEEYNINNEIVFIKCSLGITVYPLDKSNSVRLTANAEFAMNHAKGLGGDRYSYYSHKMNKVALRKRELEKQIRYALDNNGFKLFYQPQIDLHSKKVIGGEALLRMFTAENNMVSPVDFIPVAEETGLIVDVGYWIIESACKQIKCWVDDGIEDIRYGINLSARQFRDPALVEKLITWVGYYNLSSEVIDLEITESIAMDDMEETLNILRKFKESNFTISMDDFGTGHSSLSYLQQLPIDILKIDRAFIKDICHNGENGEIAKTIIDMAHNLNMGVIAEGAEEEHHIKFLVDNNCDEVQGLYYSKPLPVNEFSEYVKNFDVSGK